MNATSVIREGNDIWFLNPEMNGLFHFHRSDPTKVDWILFENESFCKSALFLKALKIENKILCIPHAAESIVVYDINSHDIQAIGLKQLPQNKYAANWPESRLLNGFCYGGNAYLLAYSYPAIIKVNPVSNKTKYIVDWTVQADNLTKPGELGGFFADGSAFANDNEHVYLPLSNSGRLLEYNLLNDTTRILMINTGYDHLSSITMLNDHEALLLGEGRDENTLGIWDISLHRVRRIVIDELSHVTSGPPFFTPIKLREYVYLFPTKNNHIYKIDRQTYEVQIATEIEAALKQDNDKNYEFSQGVLSPYKAGDMLCFIDAKTQRWYEYDTKHGMLESYVVSSDDMYYAYERGRLKYVKKNELIKEHKESLRALMDFIIL